MIAASIAEPRTTVLVRTEMPNPGPADVRIRVEGCGLCSSSLPVWEGQTGLGIRFPQVNPGTKVGEPLTHLVQELPDFRSASGLRWSRTERWLNTMSRQRTQ